MRAEVTTLGPHSLGLVTFCTEQRCDQGFVFYLTGQRQFINGQRLTYWPLAIPPC